ncbi:hypothetical protein NEFER03_0664 [Nematocida sp. LUAm3]|nr:hypothetical protein NEFER03_0664 [Nematocida sp. LUAm3]KAI5175123.1 hypothetical protein NEFER02_1084 [Nematocida sp. LUAm2]KAI5178205.1 hypothetical protein NEFER01_1383 [Nematocida sp. LUAm1]
MWILFLFLVSSIFVSVKGVFKDTTVGFYLLPRIQPEMHYISLTLSHHGEIYLEKIAEEKREQVFLQEKLDGGRICLKYQPERCINLNTSLLQGSIDYIGQNISCNDSLANSDILVRSIPYLKYVMLNIPECDNLCIYANSTIYHAETIHPFSIHIARCKPGNMENLFIFLPEDVLEGYPSSQIYEKNKIIRMFEDPLNDAAMINGYASNAMHPMHMHDAMHAHTHSQVLHAPYSLQHAYPPHLHKPYSAYPSHLHMHPYHPYNSHYFQSTHAHAFHPYY